MNNRCINIMKSFYIGTRQFEDIIIKKEFINIDNYNKIFFITISSKKIISDKSLLFVNGLFDHSLRNINKLLNFINQKFKLYLFDFRGTGHSTGESQMSSQKDLFNDLKLVFKKLPKKPLFILTYGIGGSILLAFLLVNNSIRISGLVCISFFVDLSYSKSFMRYKKKIRKFPNELIDPIQVRLKIGGEVVCNKKEAFEDMVNDPLIHFWITVKMIKSINEVTKILHQMKKQKLNFPLYFLHGKKNYLISAESVKEFFYELNSEGKKLDIFKEGKFIRKIKFIA